MCQVDRGLVVLASFLSTEHKLESLERRDPQLRKFFQSVGNFLD